MVDNSGLGRKGVLDGSLPQHEDRLPGGMYPVGSTLKIGMNLDEPLRMIRVTTCLTTILVQAMRQSLLEAQAQQRKVVKPMTLHLVQDFPLRLM